MSLSYILYQIVAWCGMDKESCEGAVWTDLEVPAGIDRKDHVENCRVQGCTSMISIAFYHPCHCGEPSTVRGAKLEDGDFLC
ncbi:hypothetical protein T06_1174 [Trichinella sp. T6]|nr:hypothetical protein T06_1174 [Trichinella sp. T6]